MPIYTYKARDTSGNLITDTMEAVNKEELSEKLIRMGYTIVRVEKESSTTKKKYLVGIGFEKITTSDMIAFISKFANLINAGISILSSLDILAQQVGKDRLKKAILAAASDIKGGDSLSQALSEHPDVFSSLFVNMVKAGEASGKLDEILQKFSRFLEWQADLEQKIKGALFYPIILLVAGVIVTLFLVTFIIPQFADMFMTLGIKLPLPTMILYKIGTGIKLFWHMLILLFIIAVFAIRRYSRTTGGKLFFDNLKLKMPIISPIYREIVISRFTRTLALLTESGMPILESLDLTKDILGNEILARAITDIRNKVEEGEPLAENLEKCGKFPLDMVRMISIGEESGNLVPMLNKLSDFYDTSIGFATKKFTTIIEPLFIITLGGMVGYIMASMLLPIFEIVNAL